MVEKLVKRDSDHGAKQRRACHDLTPTRSIAGSAESPAAGKCQDFEQRFFESSTWSVSTLSITLPTLVIMAVAALHSATQDGDLTDEQIEQMLARATERLKERPQSNELARKDEGQRYTFPKLKTGKLQQPYVSSNGDVATLDSKRLLEQKQRKSASGIRKVEGPVASKKAAQEVRLQHPHQPFLHGYEEIFPKFIP